MASEDVTPRTLIQGLIDVSSVSKSAATTSRVRARRSNTGSRVTALRRDEVKARPRSVSDFTPRSLIQGVLQHTDVDQPPPSKRARPDMPPEVTIPRPKTPGTLPRSTARRRATRLETLATPGSDPTPRSLIQGLIQAAPVETPEVHLRRSSTLNPAEFPDVGEALQGRVESDTPSPLVPEPEGTVGRSSRRLPSNLRKRQPINSADFVAGVREKLSQKQDGDRAAEGDGGELEEGDGGEVSRVVEGTDFSEGVGEGVPEALMEDDEGRSDASISEEEVAGTMEDATPQRDGEDSRNNQDEVDRGDETVNSPEQAGDEQENLEKEEAPPDSAPNSTPSSKLTPLVDRSIRGSANKQAADSTWTGQESGASTSSQRDFSPSGVNRVPDSTVRDSGSENSAASASDQPMESEMSVGGDGDGQQTVAESQSRLSGYSPLVTPRLPVGHGRPTPALKKTPVHLHPSAVERDKASVAVSKQAPHKKKPPSVPRKDTPCLPTSLTKSILMHFSKARVSKEAVVAVEKGAEVFFKRLSNDLAVYSHHGHRQTIEQSDIELLMKRQGLIKDQQSMYALIEKYLPLEYRQELIPMATAGNKVTPKPSH